MMTKALPLICSSAVKKGNTDVEDQWLFFIRLVFGVRRNA